VPGDEVGVEVPVDHPADGEPVGGSVNEVLADVAARVHDHRLPGAGVSDQVRRLRQALDVVPGE